MANCVVIKSEYFCGLDLKIQERYKKKLQLDVKDGFVQLPDPYGLKDGWETKVSMWPPTEFGDIYQYLVNSISPFNKENMKAYKSLDGYNYYKSGKVGECSVNYINKEIPVCFLKCNVVPGQNINGSYYEPWVMINKENGNISAAHCTCMAGLGEACSHIAALLFKIEAAGTLGYLEVSKTSKACIWNNYYQKNVQPVKAGDLIVKRHKFHKKAKIPRGRSVAASIQVSDEVTLQMHISQLKELAPNACFFAQGSSETDSASEGESDCQYPPNMLKHCRKIEGISEGEIPSMAHKLIKELQATQSQITSLESATKKQSHSSMWHSYRRGRITASIAHDISHRRSNTSPNNLLKRIIYNSGPNLEEREACAWGLRKEAMAAEMFTTYLQQSHTDVKVEEAGFFVHPKHAYLGGSPDRLRTCKCHSSCVVEIKCPFKYRHVSPLDRTALMDGTYCLDASGNLKRNHKYFTQVQMQMSVVGVGSCDFVVWTPVGFVYKVVLRDEPFCIELISKLNTFMTDHVVPELLVRSLE